MEGTTVNLGSITVARKNSPLSLELTTSFLIDSNTTVLGLLKQLTATDLFLHAKYGNLWMAKSGSCQLVFKTFINGQIPDPNVVNPAIISSLIDMAAECSLWEEIGLQLRAKHLPLPPLDSQGQEEQDQKPAETTYFLYHPDLSSEMIVPPTLTCVKFKGLVCKVNLQIDTSGGNRTGREPKRRRPSKKAVEEGIAQEPEPEPSVGKETKPTSSMRINPRRVTKASDVKFTDTASRKPAARKAGPGGTQLGTQNPDSADTVILLSVSKEEEREMALLLDVALRKLVGVKHAFSGIKVSSENAQFPSLIEIAPAVWNLRYLQSMTAHVKTIPAIANGMARLRNAQTATLREKVGRLLGASGAELASTARSHAGDNSEDGIVKEVGKRLWTLCQATIRVEPTVKTGSKRKAKVDGEAPVDTQAEEESTQEGYFSQLTDDGWVNYHHPPPIHDYLFDTFEEQGTDTYMETDPEAFEYDYEHQSMGDFTLFQDHAAWLSKDGYCEEEPYAESDLDHGYYGEDMTLDDFQPSSEGDYVYADALGRLHPIPRHQALQVQMGQTGGILSNELLLPFDEEEMENYEEFEDPEGDLGGYLEWGFA